MLEQHDVAQAQSLASSDHSSAVMSLWTAEASQPTQAPRKSRPRLPNIPQHERPTAQIAASEADGRSALAATPSWTRRDVVVRKGTKGALPALHARDDGQLFGEEGWPPRATPSAAGRATVECLVSSSAGSRRCLRRVVALPLCRLCLSLHCSSASLLPGVRRSSHTIHWRRPLVSDVATGRSQATTRATSVVRQCAIQPWHPRIESPVGLPPSRCCDGQGSVRRVPCSSSASNVTSPPTGPSQFCPRAGTVGDILIIQSDGALRTRPG